MELSSVLSENSTICLGYIYYARNYVEERISTIRVIESHPTLNLLNKIPLNETGICYGSKYNGNLIKIAQERLIF
jgi:hypothetical protein